MKKSGSLLRTWKKFFTLSNLGGSDIVFVGASSAISRIATFLTMAFIARKLGHDSFGLLTFGIAVAAYASILAAPGLTIWGVREVSQNPTDSGKYLFAIKVPQLILCIISIGIMLGVASQIAEKERQIVVPCSVLVLSVFFNIDWLFQGLHRFKLYAASQIITNSLILFGTILIIASPSDVWKIPLITIIAQATIASIFLLFLFRSNAELKSDFRLINLNVIKKSSLSYAMSGAMVTILHFTPIVALQYFRGSAEVGDFALGYRLCEYMTPIAMLLASVSLPKLSRISQTDDGGFVRALRALLCVTITCAVPFAALFLSESREIVAIVFSSDHDRSAQVLRVLSISVIFNFAAIAYINGLIAMKDDRTYFRSIIVAMLISVGGSCAIIPIAGVWGAVAVVSVLDLATLTVAAVAYRNTLGSAFTSIWVKPILAGTLLVTYDVIAQKLGIPFLLRILIGGIVYVWMMYPKVEIKELFGKGGP